MIVPLNILFIYFALINVGGSKPALESLKKCTPDKAVGNGLLESYFDLPESQNSRKFDYSKPNDNAARIDWSRSSNFGWQKPDKLKRFRPIITSNQVEISELRQGWLEIRAAIQDFECWCNPEHYELFYELNDLLHFLKRMVQVRLYGLYGGRPLSLWVWKKTESDPLGKEKTQMEDIQPPLDIASSTKNTLVQEGNNLSSGTDFSLHELLIKQDIAKQEQIELHGDLLLDVRKKASKEFPEYWDSLETKLVTFQSDDHFKDYFESEMYFFAKAMLLSAEYIAKLKLIPQSYIDNIKIYKPENLIPLIKYYASTVLYDSTKHIQNDHCNFYSVKPNEISCQIHRNFRPIQRAIEEKLSIEDQKLATYQLSKVFVDSVLGFKNLNERLRKIGEGFCSEHFFDNLNILSSILSSNQKNYQEKQDSIGAQKLHYVCKVIKDAITYFDSPPKGSSGLVESIEIYTIFSIIDFIKSKYEPLIYFLKPEGMKDLVLNKKIKYIDYLVKYFSHRPPREYKQGEVHLAIEYMTQIEDDGIDISKWIQDVVEQMMRKEDI
ncbi:hypothetical protein PGT21_027345 [Puccinia graminis f. sp. tritici]|uniref:Uncharacterized protein n=1 Tax=Puccinia graminis f. sp. tritici TaxID=56615 RepID=A0A5B0RU49_PUCGR|nr:hypothetical protein PGT21_027345 [Puccinia graminis f. sp. tritici]KAA1128403.1 hypothetical protein PGTUg99_021471 [Puccinia graminis f. sp. tritici]